MMSPNLLDHFERPRNAGKPERFTSIGVCGDPAAGPFMVIYLDVHEDRIRGVGYQTFSCGTAVAVGSLLTERIKGKRLDEARAVDGAALLETIGEIPLGKMHCVDLAVSALANALRKVMDDSGKKL